MPCLEVRGGTPLAGSVPVEGAKNAALPTLAATLLTDEPVHLRRIPPLRDVDVMLAMIERLGKGVERSEHTLDVVSRGVLREEADDDLVQRMRASFLVLAPIVARRGRALIPLPGGCTIGPRPVDLHLDGLSALGARVRRLDGAVEVTTDGLRAASLTLRYPSVGATEQLLMAASLARGQTVIGNAAKEPEVLDLARLLRAMGAEIEFAEDRFVVHGVDRLHGATHEVIPDRIEAATYLCAAAATGGAVEVAGVCPDHMAGVLDVLTACGARIATGESSVTAEFADRPRGATLETGPYPAVPTDLQPPLGATLSIAQGMSIVSDVVFPERYGYAQELSRLGADLTISHSRLEIRGVEKLRGVPVVARDLRGGAALVIAGLAATGTTTVSGVEHIDRGYTRLADKLRHLGGRIERIESA
ncbi:MAG: UDP-N-acetylglucosamine 1-carboxyvinyltransferase [Candidatus Bipolaricaulota bacterium]|nr:MAG: UDP-N-acetylglucosamine 1-carboxyvinyltransferase [Candidatus Bipolaricaulota bacterium]